MYRLLILLRLQGNNVPLLHLNPKPSTTLTRDHDDAIEVNFHDGGGGEGRRHITPLGHWHWDQHAGGPALHREGPVAEGWAQERVRRTVRRRGFFTATPRPVPNGSVRLTYFSGSHEPPRPFPSSRHPLPSPPHLLLPAPLTSCPASFLMMRVGVSTSRPCSNCWKLGGRLKKLTVPRKRRTSQGWRPAPD